MRKLVIAAIIIVVVSLASVYLLIPQNINIQNSIRIKCSKDAAVRIIKDSSKWQKWWPGKISTAGMYTFGNVSYNINTKAYNGFPVNMTYKNDSISNIIIVLPYSKDSTTVSWNLSVATGINPLQRFARYTSAKACAENMDSVIEHLKDFLEQPENIYNLNIVKARVTDTLLINTKQIFSQKPSTKDIYDLIYKLKNEIGKQGSSETNAPMLNITTIDSTHFLVNVAIPVNAPIKEANGIAIKRMVPGEILITNEIKGGPFTITTAFKQIETFISDYQRTVPAIPFQSLITDRILEPDTTKWITRIYYPVAY